MTCPRRSGLSQGRSWTDDDLTSACGRLDGCSRLGTWFNEGAGVAVADISGNGQPDLARLSVDAVPDGPNTGSYRIGWNLDAAGQVTGWSASAPGAGLGSPG